MTIKDMLHIIKTTNLTLLIIIIIGVVITKIVTNKNRKDKDSEKLQKWFAPFIPIIFTMAIIIITTGCFYIHIQTIKAKAYAHGLVTDDISIKAAINGIKNSPEEDLPPKDPKGSIIIYYKFGCKDCEAIYQDLISEFKKNDMKVYWICTKSETGKHLLESYPVEEVPIGVYIRKQNYNDTLTYTQRNLYYKDGDTYHIDKESIARLALLQKEGR